jgi:hypothetical protein
MGIVADCVEAFVREFFDQNPLSHLGIILLRNGIAHRLTDLSGSPETHVKALRSNMECAGDASIQNGLDLARGYLAQIPSYGHREIMLVFSALSTIDPGDIMEAVHKCKEANIRCSVVGLSAEIYICKLLCDQTGGVYSVATNEVCLLELLLLSARQPHSDYDDACAVLSVQLGVLAVFSYSSFSLITLLYSMYPSMVDSRAVLKPCDVRSFFLCEGLETFCSLSQLGVGVVYLNCFLNESCQF